MLLPNCARTKVPEHSIAVLELSGYCERREPISDYWISMSLDIGGSLKELVYSTERRGTSRFPLREEVRYRVLNLRGGEISGVGKTLNIGSGGILFTTQQSLPVGRTVEISVNWPARLDGICPLKFVATGRVVRSSEKSGRRQDRALRVPHAPRRRLERRGITHSAPSTPGVLRTHSSSAMGLQDRPFSATVNETAAPPLQNSPFRQIRRSA